MWVIIETLLPSFIMPATNEALKRASGGGPSGRSLIAFYESVTFVLMRALFPEKPNFSYNP